MPGAKGGKILSGSFQIGSALGISSMLTWQDHLQLSLNLKIPACMGLKCQPDMKAQDLLRFLLSIHSSLSLPGTVYGEAFQILYMVKHFKSLVLPCISLQRLFLPRLIGLSAAYPRLLQYYLPLNFFDNCCPNPLKALKQVKQGQASKLIP